MAAELVNAFIFKALRAAGLETYGVGPRASLAGILRHAKSVGFAPRTVLDVGAAYGQFTLQCHKIFPEARYILVEPLMEYEPFLAAVVRGLSTNAEYVLAAAAAEPGDVLIHLHPDLVGSSLYREQEGSHVDGSSRKVPAVTLDRLVGDREIEPPCLVKVDVQGAELDVLLGAGQALRLTEYIILEVSLLEFFKGGPQLNDVIAFMKARGLVPYDVSGLLYRPFDGALAQLDLAFVKEKGLFRSVHAYATPEQREAQNRKFQARHRNLLKRYRYR